MRAADMTAELVSGLIADQFPEWAGLPVRPVEAGGIDNRTFRLGQTMSVRLPSASSYREQVRKEHRWLPVLARQLPLPVSTPLARGVPGWAIWKAMIVLVGARDDPADAAYTTGVIEAIMADHLAASA